ncbi:hypothetical protein F5B18DRAFT_627357 [Nemania serpens]|nr:hypothetical protein F5B18DRAFT_627357 [Nemania serpens]
MAFSPNVLEFVSSSRDGTIKIWEFAAPKDNANQGPKRERCIKAVASSVAFTSNT